MPEGGQAHTRGAWTVYLGEIWLVACEVHKFLKVGWTCDLCICEEHRCRIVEALGGVGTCRGRGRSS